MRISVLKFGNTPLYYTPDGTVAKGIIFTRKTFAASISEWAFAASVVLLATMFAASSGDAYAARFAVAMGLENAPFFEKFFPDQMPVLSTPKVTLPSAPAVVEQKTVPVFNADKAVLSIPAIRVTAPIVDTTSSLSVLDADLTKGVVRWPLSMVLAKGGATVILGHSSAPIGYGGAYGSVFANLDQLADGTDVTLSDGVMVLRYRVTGRIVVDPKDFNDTAKLKGDGERLILVTCWPTGTSWKRIAVTAERIQ